MASDVVESEACVASARVAAALAVPPRAFTRAVGLALAPLGGALPDEACDESSVVEEVSFDWLAALCVSPVCDVFFD
jgi:hypothetical protein